jgi:hypothetical protein
MSETTPIEEPDKKKLYFPKIILLTIAGILVFMLSLSYNPDPKSTNASTKPPVYYPIEKPPIEINIKAASADEFPKIRIGSGCSFSRNNTRHSANNNIQDI